MMHGMGNLMAIVETADSLPPNYVEALTRLGRVLQQAHGIVVGGAAVTFYTGGAILSGDFDFVIQMNNEAFAEARGQKALWPKIEQVG